MGSNGVVRGVDKESITQALIEYFKTHGKIFSRREYGRRADKPYSVDAIEKRVGWGALKRLAAEHLGLGPPPVFDKSCLVDPERLTGDDFDRLAIMAGLKQVGLPTRFRQMLANLIISSGS